MPKKKEVEVPEVKEPVKSDCQHRNREQHLGFDICLDCNQQLTQ